MTKRLFIALFIAFLSVSHGQLLTLTSVDSLNGKPVKEFYTTAWLKFSGFVDAEGIPNESAMHLPSIPTERDSASADPQFHADLYQTRLMFVSKFQTKNMGEIFSYIETDFYGGGGGGLRLRHAYVSFANWRIGQAWSGFTDVEAWPNITDFDGPATGAWVRSAQIAYFIHLKQNATIMLSVESPTTDYGRYLFVDSLIKPALQGIPDLVGHYEIRWPRGHFQIATVGRVIEYKNVLHNRNYLIGGGTSISGSLQVNKDDKFIYQVAGGKGIARYLVSFGGGGWDAIPNHQGDLDLVPIAGGYLGYQHYWGKKSLESLEENHFSSTFVYGYVYLKNPIETPKPSLLTGSYASANLYWHLSGPMQFAVEGIYGYRTDEYESPGDDLRVQFIMEYNF